MLKDGERTCEMCQRVIAKGERYIIRMFEQDEIPQSFSQAGARVRFDICKDCQDRLRVMGEEAVD